MKHVQLNRIEHKLKPKHKVSDCPDCGGHRLVAVDYRYGNSNNHIDEWIIFCKKCGRESDVYPTMNSAIFAWNCGNGTPGDYLEDYEDEKEL